MVGEAHVLIRAQIHLAPTHVLVELVTCSVVTDVHAMVSPY